MRVIAGTARSLKLQTIEGMNTRPTTDRTKETLFNIIGNNLYGVVFLDLLFVALDSIIKNETILNIVFMDPPYGKELEKRVLLKLNEASNLDDDIMIIVESDLQTEFSYLEQTIFEIYKEKRYKTNKHTFIRKRYIDE